MLEFGKLTQVIGGEVIALRQNLSFEHLLLDSRKILSPATSLFFAIRGERHDGHAYLKDLYEKGVRQFVVEAINTADFPDACFIKVPSTLMALQQLAAWHRNNFKIPVVGITGSNGKTVVKEWLSQLLSKSYNIVRSPKSYNSQVGVPLSVWQINEQHEFGIFEAGISKPGEMEKLQSIILPSIGIFTNVSSAHDEGFKSMREKVFEKLKLFKDVELLIYCKDYHEIDKQVNEQFEKINTFSWSRKKGGDIVVKEIDKINGKSKVYLLHEETLHHFTLPFADDASIENAIHCVCLLLLLKIERHEIQTRINSLHKVAMRLEMKEGINGCHIIDDTYNSDLAGLSIAINFLDQQTRREEKSVILSDVLESGIEEKVLYKEIGGMLKAKNISKVVGIGETISRNKEFFSPDAVFFPSTETFLANFDSDYYQDEIILVKGARKFQFERIVGQLQQKVHGTVLEINLDALSANLNFYKSKLKPNTKVMVMVKAFAYGSGSFETANLLQFHRVDYLAVAYADEGVSLRENGISLPIMVMNPVQQSFDKLFQYNLEPEIFSFKLLNEFLDFLVDNGISSKIHLKIDTGMRRLGFEEKEVNTLCDILVKNPQLQVASIFTHMAAADEEVHNEFSKTQLTKFNKVAIIVEEKLGYKIMRHAMNSAGILRFPDNQMDMVRLGIGLYGIEANGLFQDQLQTVGTLKTIISQIKQVSKGETVGYSRKGKVESADKKIATIAIGYADGYNRKFSNGVGKVLVRGKLCPVIGNVCMDMTMVDITGVDAQEGDEVIIFGKDHSILNLARDIETIPYEILTNVGERVKRVFYTE